MNTPDITPETLVKPLWHGVPIIESINPTHFLSDMAGTYITKWASDMLKRSDDARYFVEETGRAINTLSDSGITIQFIIIDGAEIEASTHKVSVRIHLYKKENITEESWDMVFLGPENRPPTEQIYIQTLTKIFPSRSIYNKRAALLLSRGE